MRDILFGGGTGWAKPQGIDGAGLSIRVREGGHTALSGSELI